MYSNAENSLGFTLMELLVTVAIVGILTSMAAPSFSTFVQDRKHKASLNDFRNALAYTRSEAVKRGLPTVICASSNGSNCNGSTWSDGWLVFVDENGNDNKDSAEEQLQLGAGLDSGYSLIGTADVDTKIRYQPDGDSVTTGAITLCDPRGVSEAKALIITPSGRARESNAGLGGTPLICS
ncbi:MAG: GspH/FimT family pseudopilin [Cellvibrionaceae bacterium]|nr:GspH/FimT family pseudopilin [Cellvibrionaceae bacterium]